MPDDSGARQSLAPQPDFRHVTLISGARAAIPWTIALGTALLSMGAGAMFGWREAFCTGALGGTWAAVDLYSRKRNPEPATGKPVSMAIVPWGVIVDEGAQTRILRWSAIDRIDVDTVYGRDQASDVTRHSIVVVQTATERLTGRTFGAPSLERLLAHREAYARESSHVAAIDLDGGEPAGEEWEPQVERLLLASRQLIGGGGTAVHQSAIGYRGRRATIASEEVAVRLREVLRDRTERVVDPRPLCAIVAAELQISSLAPELAQLVSSPHPLTAAVARAAGAALGLPKSRLGVLEEVAPFLPESDVEALSAWSGARRT